MIEHPADLDGVGAAERDMAVGDEARHGVDAEVPGLLVLTHVVGEVLARQDRGEPPAVETSLAAKSLEGLDVVDDLALGEVGREEPLEHRGLQGRPALGRPRATIRCALNELASTWRSTLMSIPSRRPMRLARSAISRASSGPVPWRSASRDRTDLPVPTKLAGQLERGR